MLLALLFAAEAIVPLNHFRLVCPATQSGEIASNTVATVNTTSGNANINLNASKPYFADVTAYVEIDGDKGRATQSNSNYWSELTDIVITDAEITATVHLHRRSKTRMRIDRMTGDLAVPLGSTVLHGICRPAPEDAKRAF
jgi:hypothetical protein